MERNIKVGIGIMIFEGKKLLLGHRVKGKKDTGGIYEVDCWTLPGGKQEYGETFFSRCKTRSKGRN
ncbi:MAG: NUDIX domain-containing protein [Clostridia bacterium]|nr:NUDIX domain-containing protein [Clostridia bacterium]